MRLRPRRILVGDQIFMSAPSSVCDYSQQHLYDDFPPPPPQPPPPRPPPSPPPPSPRPPPPPKPPPPNPPPPDLLSTADSRFYHGNNWARHGSSLGFLEETYFVPHDGGAVGRNGANSWVPHYRRYWDRYPCLSDDGSAIHENWYKNWGDWQLGKGACYITISSILSASPAVSASPFQKT